MTNAQIVALGVRLFCIWLAVYVLREAPALWRLNTEQFPDSGAATTVVIVFGVLAAATIALWMFPLTIARKLLSKPTLDEPTTLPAEQVQRAGFCLLGLWVLTGAIPRTFYYAVMLYHSTRPESLVELQARNYAALVQIAVELCLGLWLLFGARGLLGVIRWARTAGTDGPSGRLAEDEARQRSPNP